MNNVFAAEKIGVTIDSVVISKDGKAKCVFCQQMSHLTNGIYSQTTIQQLLPRLLSDYTLESTLMNKLNPTGQTENEIDWRMKAFHEDKLIDNGYVCSACFTVLSKSYDRCPVCQIDFVKK